MSDELGGTGGGEDSFKTDMALLEADDTTASEGTDITITEDEEAEPESSEEIDTEEKAEDTEEPEEEPEPEEVDPNVLPGRPSFKDLKQAYPDILKRFPGLREALHNESKYVKEFPTIEQAQDANRMIGAMRILEQQLTEGDSTHLIRGLKSDGSIDKFVDKFLPTLNQEDPQLFLRVVTPLFTTLYNNMVNVANNSGDKQMKGAAQRMSLHLFGTLEPPKDFLKQIKGSPKTEEDPEKLQLRKQIADRQNADFQAFQDDCVGAAAHELRRTAGIGLDPENKYSQFQRDALLDKVLTELDAQLGKNELHRREMKALWQQAQRSGLSREIRDRIVKTYLGRAKPILKTITARINPGTKTPSPGTKVPVNRGVPSKTPGRISPKQVDWGKTSDDDYMNDRVTLRK